MLFSATVLENITYGLDIDSECKDQVVIDACKKANIHKFIMGLKNQYNTYIGEQGMLISGGQKQRISIARALIRDPQILILDEPENNLPQPILKKIFKNLNLNDKITLLITHKIIGEKIFENENHNIINLDN